MTHGVYKSHKSSKPQREMSDFILRNLFILNRLTMFASIFFLATTISLYTLHLLLIDKIILG